MNVWPQVDARCIVQRYRCNNLANSGFIFSCNNEYTSPSAEKSTCQSLRWNKGIFNTLKICWSLHFSRPPFKFNEPLSLFGQCHGKSTGCQNSESQISVGFFIMGLKHWHCKWQYFWDLKLGIAIRGILISGTSTQRHKEPQRLQRRLVNHVHMR